MAVCDAHNLRPTVLVREEDLEVVGLEGSRRHLRTFSDTWAQAERDSRLEAKQPTLCTQECAQPGWSESVQAACPQGSTARLRFQVQRLRWALPAAQPLSSNIRHSTLVPPCMHVHALAVWPALLVFRAPKFVLNNFAASYVSYLPCRRPAAAAVAQAGRVPSRSDELAATPGQSPAKRLCSNSAGEQLS